MSSDLSNLREWIHTHCGLVLSENKSYLIHHRLGPLLKEFKLRDFEDMYFHLKQHLNQGLTDKVITEITTHETFFFRDKTAFKELETKIVPYLDGLIQERMQKSGGGRRGAKVNIWCAGASTGQEPYSLAMLIDRYIKHFASKRSKPSDYSILASDISSEVLSKALAGYYNDLELSRGVTQEYRDAYFQKEGDAWKVCPNISEMITFRKTNLLDIARLNGSYDLILCRYTLIYFDETTRSMILERLHGMLNVGGYLFLGQSEPSYKGTEIFESIRTKDCHYYKKPAVSDKPLRAKNKNVRIDQFTYLS